MASHQVSGDFTAASVGITTSLSQRIASDWLIVLSPVYFYFRAITDNLTASVLTVGDIDCKVNGRRIFIFLVSSIVLLATACGTVGTIGLPEPSIPVSGINVDLTYKEFYEALGGQSVLGPLLSGQIEYNGKMCQFTQAALMCLNKSAAESNHRYQLEPLGQNLYVADDPQIPMPAHPNDRDLGNGFRLHHEFTALYDRIYGDLYAGRPLTNLRVNHAAQRYEQFFENVGFFRGFNEPEGSAHLIPYGSYLCGPHCSQQLAEYWSIVRSGSITQPFEVTLQRMGWIGFGHPISRPRVADDGSIEQLYDNALLYAPADDITRIRPRPLVLWMGAIVVQPLAEKNPHEQLVFYELENGLGHNVPTFFDAFIAAHGGREMAGKPVTELFPMDNGLYCQCFENYCLDYDPNKPSEQRVSMSPLGWRYAQVAAPDMIALKLFSPATMAIELTEAAPQVGRGEQQRITVRVVSLPDRQPIQLAAGTLIINLPDQPALNLQFPPTNPHGQSDVVVPFLDGLPNMSVVEYQACLSIPESNGVCAVDSFVFRGE